MKKLASNAVVGIIAGGVRLDDSSLGVWTAVNE